MPSRSLHPLLRAGLPALIVAAIALAIWIAMRTAGPLKGDAFFGWLCLLLIAATVVAITLTAYAPTPPPRVA